MLKGKALGNAIKEALDLKGLKNADVAREFGVRPPSVSGWIKTGRIQKGRLLRIIEMTEDVVGREHWGLEPKAAPKRNPIPGVPVLYPDDPTVKGSLTQAQRTFGQLVNSVLPLLNTSQLETLTKLVVDFVGRNASSQELVKEEQKLRNK